MIADDDVLHRRLAPMMVKRDGTVSSVAYVKNGQPDNEISVDLAWRTTTTQTLLSRPSFGIGAITARVPRSLGFEVTHDPLPDNPAHALIRGQSSKEKCRILASETRVVIHPR
ncbi:MAG TPA: hypothetical protein VGQ36_19650 [Thermoanaerobaculia bacterium]|nr:hypothetical protein [Thermoanaerobaculia bacterium]